jgi:hypothetical protein
MVRVVSRFDRNLLGNKLSGRPPPKRTSLTWKRPRGAWGEEGRHADTQPCRIVGMRRRAARAQRFLTIGKRACGGLPPASTHGAHLNER